MAVTLYESREYVRHYMHSHPRARLTGPFSSTRLPSPPVANCILRLENGQQRWGMWYSELEGTIQGLMDYEYFPSTGGAASVEFKIMHKMLGEIGTGSLRALRPQGGREIHIQKQWRRRQARFFTTESRNNRYSKKNNVESQSAADTEVKIL